MWHEEFRVNDPQRGLIWVKGHASPERQQDESGADDGFLLDVTETKQLESHRWQSRHLESIARLVGGIAHSFNNMMTVVIGYSDVIAETLTPSDPNQPRIAKIKDVAHQASAMTAHLLAFGRLQPRHTVVMDLKRTHCGGCQSAAAIAGGGHSIACAAGSELVDGQCGS